jgi:hypothetical protein
LRDGSVIALPRLLIFVKNSTVPEGSCAAIVSIISAFSILGSNIGYGLGIRIVDQDAFARPAAACIFCHR